MGSETQTKQNLELVGIDEDRGCILIRGSIPGAANSYVLVKQAAKLDMYKKRGGKEQERSKNPLKASKKAAAGR
jgi:large subunit ribosomal protein L3